MIAIAIWRLRASAPQVKSRFRRSEAAALESSERDSRPTTIVDGPPSCNGSVTRIRPSMGKKSFRSRSGRKPKGKCKDKNMSLHKKQQTLNRARVRLAREYATVERLQREEQPH